MLELFRTRMVVSRRYVLADSVSISTPFSDYLFYLTKAMTDAIDSGAEDEEQGGQVRLLKAITEPVTKLVVRINEDVIERIAKGEDVEDSLRQVLMNAVRPLPSFCIS